MPRCVVNVSVAARPNIWDERLTLYKLQYAQVNWRLVEVGRGLRDWAPLQVETIHYTPINGHLNPQIILFFCFACESIVLSARAQGSTRGQPKTHLSSPSILIPGSLGCF